MAAQDGDGNSRPFVIKARGLPWSVSDDEIAEFFEPSIVLRTRDQIHRQMTNGRFSGDIFLELYTQEEQQSAIAKHKENMGKRYIEVFESDWSEMQRAMGGGGAGMRGGPRGDTSGVEDDAAIVKLRGLPFQVTKQEIKEFFEGCELKGDQEGGIHFVPDRQGRGSCNGEAFVQLASNDPQLMETVLAKNRQTIGSRWIEVFRASKQEMDSIMYPPSHGDGYGYGYGYGYDQDPYYSRGPGPYRGGPSRGFRGGAGAGPYGGGRGGFQRGGPYGRPPPQQGGFGGGFGGGSGLKLKMSGLPFEATYEDCVAFFQPIEVVNTEVMKDHQGRSHSAICEFANAGDYEAAMKRHKQHMGHRYIELHPLDEGHRGGGDDFGMGGGHGGGDSSYAVKMFGMPFEVTENQIYEFFEGLQVVNVDMARDQGGRVQEAFVTFASQADLDGAMERNKQNIGHRYVVLQKQGGGFDGGFRGRGGRGGFQRGGGGFRGRGGNYGGFA